MIKARQVNCSSIFSGSWVILTANKNKMIDLIMNILPITLYIHVKSLPGHIQK